MKTKQKKPQKTNQKLNPVLVLWTILPCLEGSWVQHSISQLILGLGGLSPI